MADRAIIPSIIVAFSPLQLVSSSRPLRHVMDGLLIENFCNRLGIMNRPCIVLDNYGRLSPYFPRNSSSSRLLSATYCFNNAINIVTTTQRKYSDVISVGILCTPELPLTGHCVILGRVTSGGPQLPKIGSDGQSRYSFAPPLAD